MKVLATKGFSEKFSSLGDANFRDKLLTFIDSVNGTNDISKIIKLSSVGIDSIYVYRLDNYRLFFSIENDETANDYMLLVDFITKGYGTKSINNKNPNRNNMINPNRNNMINPNRNNMINPNRNNMINPNRNNMINPNRNNMINPNVNPSYQGLYVFDMDLNPKEFIVETNDTVIQFFDFNLTNTRFGVPHSKNGYVLFDLSNNWIGHLESDSQNGYNEFDSDNNWIGIVK